VWSADERAARPRLAICTTYREEPALALLRAIRDGQIRGEATVMIGNRPNCRSLAEQFGVPWHMVGDERGAPDDDRLIAICDRSEVDYIVLARYMRVLPPASCWKYAGGRIINLHHGLLPSFPGLRPYEDAYRARMLTFGATCHFIVPELDAGNQIIHQSTYTVPPGMKLADIVRLGQQDNEPRCLVEGVRRVVDREVELHFHRVVARARTV
jgi:formyltetrahydrofolate deformylase